MPQRPLLRLDGTSVQWQGEQAQWRVAARAVPWTQVVLAWLTARVIVLLAFAVAHVFGRPGRRTGLLGWDADWYRRIAEHGYQHVPAEGIRFFPELPLVARFLSSALGASVGVALLLVSNVAALAFAAAAYRLAIEVGLPQSAASRMPWVVSFTPASFVFVMGYAESLAAILVCLLLLCARRNQWLVVAALGLCVGLLRPTGVVVALPIAIEVARGWGRFTLAQRSQALAAVLAPAAGLAAFLWWSWHTFGNAMLPFNTQASSELRGGVAVDPFRTVWSAAHSLAQGSKTYVAIPLHLGWVLLSLGALVLCFRRFPLSLTAWSAVTLGLAITARAFTSFERYSASAFPLLLAVAPLLTTSRRRWVAGTAAGLTLFGYALMAFLHLYIP